VNVASFCAVRFGLSLQLAPMLASGAKTIPLKADLVQDALPFSIAFAMTCRTGIVSKS
jgi:hypothetical protein